MDNPMKTDMANLRQPEDIMRFFDNYFEYGCIDVDGVKHINSLGGNDFRAKYRTLSLENALENRIGACIEFANVTKYLLDRMGIPNRLFCTRGYNEQHIAPDDLYLVHCFVLAYFEDKVLCVEYSDSEKRGIYIHDSVEKAIRETHKIFSDKFILNGAIETVLNEYTQLIPGGLSFLEFNKYMNDNSTTDHPKMCHRNR